MADNAAVLQQRVTKGTNPFLATLAEPGEAQFLTVLKPCSILLPHTHQRANEIYTVLFGTRLPCPAAEVRSVRVCMTPLQQCGGQLPRAVRHELILWL